mmetsp:Transcript_80034/g.259266  ORF Transcript_80034/g.259266 Transcript_80034/m.259266 type:complete len:333 (-) Transcript_80034:614-1612(-)
MLRRGGMPCPSPPARQAQAISGSLASAGSAAEADLAGEAGCASWEPVAGSFVSAGEADSAGEAGCAPWESATRRWTCSSWASISRKGSRLLMTRWTSASFAASLPSTSRSWPRSRSFSAWERPSSWESCFSLASSLPRLSRRAMSSAFCFSSCGSFSTSFLVSRSSARNWFSRSRISDVSCSRRCCSSLMRRFSSAAASKRSLSSLSFSSAAFRFWSAACTLVSNSAFSSSSFSFARWNAMVFCSRSCAWRSTLRPRSSVLALASPSSACTLLSSSLDALRAASTSPRLADSASSSVVRRSTVPPSSAISASKLLTLSFMLPNLTSDASSLP